MSIVMEEDIKHLTAKRKAALVLEIIQGKKTQARLICPMAWPNQPGTNLCRVA